MPEGKSISFAQGEYPGLEGLPDGSVVRMDVKATLTNDANGGGTLTFDAVEIEAEGMADRQLKQMTQNNTAYAGASKAPADDF